MRRNDGRGKERRQYIRLDSVFPVQFSVLSLDGKNVLAGCLQGFTRDIGKGGICLTVNNFAGEIAQTVIDRQAKLFLDIEMPFSRKPIKAQTSVAWITDVAGCPNRYMIGLRYENIAAIDAGRIIRYARAKKFFVPAVMTMICVLGVALAMGTYLNVKLIKGNKALIEQMVSLIQESSIAKQKIKLISKEKEDLKIRINTLEARIRSVKEEKAATREISGLNALDEELNKEKELLEAQLIVLQNRESAISEDLLRLDKQRIEVEKDNFDKMYAWLKVHQNPRTGLIASFEGDAGLSGWAFIYDQSLVVQACANFADFTRAQKLLDFFSKKAGNSGGLFYNAYYADDGSPAEYVVHSGPNIWLGIAALQYAKKSNDDRYLGFAEGIAEKIMALQAQDKDGGIRGGPSTHWYSTEHNLDAYAFFNMLAQVTEKPAYRAAADKVLDWIHQYSYGRDELPINRGKGDSTIATDTYAWAVASIGPEKLQSMGMNPDRIMEFAEGNCSVEARHCGIDGKIITLKGYDFAAKRNIARGGVISSEWTAQMAISFKIMADYYFKKGMIAKARSYNAKADECLLCLSRMIVTSPSPSGQGSNCLPYSNQEFVDTGHGWFTPRGKRTGSVSGTAYTLFAFYNYNPLELKE